jgi:hypothetical protein
MNRRKPYCSRCGDAWTFKEPLTYMWKKVHLAANDDVEPNTNAFVCPACFGELREAWIEFFETAPIGRGA